MALCRTHEIKERYIPRDVRTRWNSTYDMLVVALAYRDVYTDFTMNKEHGLSTFKLSAKEWKIGEELKDVLKVNSISPRPTLTLFR